MEAWIKLCSSNNQIEADFLVGLLKSNEIEVQFVSKKDSWNKFDVFENTMIDIFVESHNLDEAKIIINSKPESID